MRYKIYEGKRGGQYIQRRGRKVYLSSFGSVQALPVAGLGGNLASWYKQRQTTKPTPKLQPSKVDKRKQWRQRAKTERLWKDYEKTVKHCQRTGKRALEKWAQKRLKTKCNVSPDQLLQIGGWHNYLNHRQKEIEAQQLFQSVCPNGYQVYDGDICWKNKDISTKTKKVSRLKPVKNIDDIITNITALDSRCSTRRGSLLHTLFSSPCYK